MENHHPPNPEKRKWTACPVPDEKKKKFGGEEPRGGKGEKRLSQTLLLRETRTKSTPFNIGKSERAMKGGRENEGEECYSILFSLQERKLEGILCYSYLRQIEISRGGKRKRKRGKKKGDLSMPNFSF